MIESGSGVAGVDPRGWALPPGVALRVERPAADLQPLFTDYVVSAPDGAGSSDARTLIMPGWPTVRLAVTRDTTSIRIGPRRYDTPPRAALMGTSSRTADIVTNGGIFVTIGITPLGWSRLSRLSGDSVRDRLIPLSDVIASRAVTQLCKDVGNSDLARDLPALLDDFWRAHLLAPCDKEDMIRGLTRIIVEGATEDIATASEMLDISPNTLRRLSTRFFGFPPKLLLVRARFTQSMIRMMLAEGRSDYSIIAASYFDKSHFLRDAHRFLGTTPRRFLRHDHRLMAAYFRAQRAVFGRHPLAGSLIPAGHS